MLKPIQTPTHEKDQKKKKGHHTHYRQKSKTIIAPNGVFFLFSPFKVALEFNQSPKLCQ